MPRDSKTPLIQKIAHQARLSFRGLRAPPGQDQAVADRLAQLISLVTAIRAADLKVAPPTSEPSAAAAGLQGPPGPQGPPVTYMHICETEVFSMGVFLLRGGASIPLHDHPGMNGMLKVLYGTVSVHCFDKLEGGPSPAPPLFRPPLAPADTASVWRAARRSVTQYSETSGPCLLSPARDNLHRIDAVDGPAAFLDILAPPYNPDDGRDCHYYKVLVPAAGGRSQQGGGGGGGVAAGGSPAGGLLVWRGAVPRPPRLRLNQTTPPGPRQDCRLRRRHDP
uniref:2-aminoethanethiol (cysteamine) dioxygenase a n=1 Tax=Salarias fasciatus TaxID=181472 RepID=A0A672H3L3_SALFA